MPIPKANSSISLKDFRPISLCNVTLKIISKVLVYCIRPHLDNLIGLLQRNFIPQWGSSNNAIIAQEIAHHMHNKKGKIGYLMHKINFEKVYDRIDWDFLKLTLTDFGFP